jgi:hypothetical protein
LSPFAADFGFNEIVTGSLVWALLRIEFAFVLVFAELNSRVVLGEIIVCHPESSIVFLLETYLFLGFWCPRVGLVRPGSSPFEGAPWVSELNDVNFVSVFVFDGGGFDQAVSMASNEAELLVLIGVVTGYTSAHDVVGVVGLHDHVPHVLLIFDNVLVSWRSCQISQGLSGLSSINSLITAMKFGPALLKNHNPKLIPM